MAVVTTNTSAAQLTSTAGIILLVPIGTASADRVVVVVIPDAQATTYTIGGVTAVPDADAIFFSALVPTGTTATVASADASPFTLSGVWAITGGVQATPYAAGFASAATVPYSVPANTALVALAADIGNTSSTLAFSAGATADGSSYTVTSISSTALDGHHDYASPSSGNVTFTGSVASPAVFWAAYSTTIAPVTTTVTATGASSHTFTSGDLPSGSGTLSLIEAWGAGASAGRRGHGSGGGAYASDATGWAIAVGDTIYWNNPAGPAGTTTTSGAAPASDSFIRLNTNAAPTTTGQQGVLAKSGAAGTATVDGAGGTTATSIGATSKFAGGNGGNVGSGTTLRGGGGSGASSTGTGNNASGATGGATKAPDGGAGGAGTTSGNGGSGTAPGGAGGSNDLTTGNGGAGARGQLRYTFQDGGGAPAVVTSPQGDIEGGIGDPGIGLPQQGLHAIEKGISAWRYEPMRKAA